MKSIILWLGWQQMSLESEKPKRSRHEWHVDDLNKYAELEFGELHRLLGKELTFEDEPVEI